MHGRRGPGALEAAVLAIVAATPGPVSVAEVVQELPGQPAYTTVMTTLARLHDKGALERIRVGRAYHYSMVAPRSAVDDAVTARRMHRLLSDRNDRAGVLARFVAELDPADERLLAELLAESSDDPGEGRAHR